MKRFRSQHVITEICLLLITAVTLLPDCSLAEKDIWNRQRLLRSFSLINLDTGKLIQQYSPLRNRVVINLADFPVGKIRIRANVRRRHRKKVKKVHFRINGERTKRPSSKRPFLLMGLRAQQIQLWQASGTSYRLRATPFYLNGRRKLQRGKSTFLSFSVVNSGGDLPDDGSFDPPDGDPSASPTVVPTATVDPTLTPQPSSSPLPWPTTRNTY